MKRLFVPQTSVAGLAAKACCALFISVVLTVMGGGALFAQTRSGGACGEARRRPSAWRLHADRGDRFWRNRFSASV